jgi:Endonuclease-reverse transcriptase
MNSSTKVLQVNLNRSSIATESALQVAIELKVDILVVQEPWLAPNTSQADYTTTRSVLHSAFYQILPADLSLRPRTLIYVAKNYTPIVNIASISPKDPDLLIIDIKEGNTCIQLLNIYNKASQLGTSPRTLERALYPLQQLHPNSILLGDFNTHHPWWDPLANRSTSANNLVEWLENHNLELINTPGIGTFFRPHLEKESVLDLTFATSYLASRIED